MQICFDADQRRLSNEYYDQHLNRIVKIQF